MKGRRDEVEEVVVMMVAAVVTMVVMVGLIGCGVEWYHRLIAGPDIVSHTHTHILRITWRWRA